MDVHVGLEKCKCKPATTETHTLACANTCPFSFMSVEHISQRKRVLFQSVSHLLGKTRSIAQSMEQSNPKSSLPRGLHKKCHTKKVLIEITHSERVSQVCDAAGGEFSKRRSWQAWHVSLEAHVSLHPPSPVQSVIGESWLVDGNWQRQIIYQNKVGGKAPQTRFDVAASHLI